MIWLGEDSEQTVVIHSQRSGIVLSGEALKSWISEGQKKSFSERTTAIEVHGMKIISVYQPLWSNGVEGIEEYRHCLENEVARTPKTKVIIIGGDHNVHIGRERACETNGRYGLTTQQPKQEETSSIGV